MLGRRTGRARWLVIGWLCLWAFVAQAAFAQSLPTLSIDDASVNEGDVGDTALVFVVRLSAPAPAGGVVFDIATSDGAADASDYSPVALSLRIPEGETSASVSVAVHGDFEDESDEFVQIEATGLSGALPGDASAIGTLLNDDATVAFEGREKDVIEGDAGDTTVAVDVVLSAAKNRVVRVNYATADNRASAPGDYRAEAGTLTFLPGELRQTLSLHVHGDTEPENWESFQIALSDPDGVSLGQAAYTVQILDDDDTDFALMPETLSSAEIGLRYDQGLYVSSGQATIALVSGSLPDGIQLTTVNGHQYLIGIPTAAGTYTFTLSARETYGGRIASRTYSMDVVPSSFVLPTAPLPEAIVDVDYGAQLPQPHGSIGPYHYVLMSGALPAGMTLSATGQILGSPSSPGDYAFTVAVFEDTVSARSSRADFSIRVKPHPMVIVPSLLIRTWVSWPYEVALLVNYGVAPIRFDIVSGQLPPGLELRDGLIVGTATTPGHYAFTVEAVDSAVDGPTTARQDFAIDVDYFPLTFVTATLYRAWIGQPYEAPLQVFGGLAPYTYTLESGALPPGLALGDDGVLRGTPEQAGTYTFAIAVSDAQSGTPARVVRTFTLETALPQLSVYPSLLNNARVNVPYVQAFWVNGGAPPYAITVSSGALPPGLTLDARGMLVGTPQATGVYRFAVDISDSTPMPGPARLHAEYALTVDPPQLVQDTQPLPTATEGRPYAFTFRVSGGVPPYRYELQNGRLPAGLSLDPGGLLSGAVAIQQAGDPRTYPFELRISDASGQSTIRYDELRVSLTSPMLSPSQIPSGTAGMPYEATFVADGIVGPYRIESVGPLPAGMQFDPVAWRFSGTPTRTGSVMLSFTLIDGRGLRFERGVMWSVSPGHLVLASDAPPDGEIGRPYDFAIVASGGVAPYRFALADGTGPLPPGLHLDAQGRLSGTPSLAGTFIFDVAATDSTLGTTSAAVARYTMTIRAPHIVIAPVRLPDAMQAQAYRLPLSASGGTAPYRFEIVSGQLPQGIVLSADGVLSGMPEAPGIHSLAVRATDALGFAVEQNYVFTVLPPVPVAQPQSVSTAAGASVTVDLTTGAMWGPFTSAEATSVSPTDAGTIRIEQHGSGIDARFLLTFAPRPRFVGPVSVTFVLRSANGTSAPAVLAIDVRDRPDPGHDADVRGLVDAQTAAADRFVSAQIRNVDQRLEQLHRGSANRSAMGVGFAAVRRCTPNVGALPGRPCPAIVAPQVSTARSEDASSMVGVWAGGTLRGGDRDAGQGRSGLTFESDGLSVGVDRRFGAAWAAGLGLGYGRDRTRIGRDRTHVDGTANSFVVYASRHGEGRAYVDGVFGYQTLRYALRRSVSGNGHDAYGHRDGDQWFGAVSVGAEYDAGAWRLAPYGRFEGARGRLFAYREQAEPVDALSFAEQPLRHMATDLGMRVEYRGLMRHAGFVPQFRIEYQRELTGSGETWLRYADWEGGPTYALRPSGSERERLEAALAARLVLGRDWHMRIGVRSRLGTGSADGSVEVSVSRGF